VLGITTAVSDDGHPKNDEYSLTDDGIAVVGTRVPLKTPKRILVTLVGIVIVLNDEHPSKALPIIVVTLVGIMTLESDVHP